MREGRLPSIGHLRIFGSKAMVKIPSATVPNKLSPRAEQCTFVGYANQGTTESYRFIINTGKYFTSGNAKFNELPLVKNYVLLK
jgi:isocitrate dehydrogenase kinase/phosphatase